MSPTSTTDWRSRSQSAYRRFPTETITQFRALDRPAQVLLVNMLINNIGFYMLIPYLAAHMSVDLGMAAWLVGLVLGVRNLSQQGLFLIGGSLSDRLGHKPVIVIGCLLRSVGFCVFGFVESAPGLIFASMLSGVAAAFSTPSARSYLTQAAGGQRVEAFAFLSMGLTAGSLLGPVVGALLLVYDFKVASVAAAGIFAILAVIQYRFLPLLDAPAESSKQSVLADWREVISNRAFVLFSLSMVGFMVLSQQAYLGIPLEVRRVTGSDTGLAVVLTLAGVLSVAAQVPVTLWSKAHWRPAQSIAIGVAAIGLAFTPVLLASGWLPVADQTLTGVIVNLAPLALTCCLIALAEMLAMPYIQSTITMFGGGRLIGTYVGMYYLFQGIGAAVGQMGSGSLFDLASGMNAVWLPWLVLLTVGLASAGAVAVLDRRGLLDGPLPEPAHA